MIAAIAHFVCVVLFASWRSRPLGPVMRDGPVPMVLCAEWAFLFEALVLGRFPNDRPSLNGFDLPCYPVGGSQ